MTKFLLRALPALLLFAAPPAVARAQDGIANSVVKIHTTQRVPDFLRPWTKQPPQEISGSGMVLEGNRILTNAHVVKFASQVYVQPHQSSEKLRATVVGIALGIDLAVLELEDAAFFESHPALAFAEELPEVKDEVNVYGYPMGGSDLSITKGIVSRIEFSSYDFGVAGLRIQVDAALNPGNSGGPALVGDQVVGVVFSGIPEADNIGYLIPVEEIRMFLEDVADGSYAGKPHTFDGFQTLENDALRARLGAPADVTGLVVTEPFGKSEETPLHRWDVLTSIGEHDVQNDGMVAVKPNLRLNFRYFVPRLAQAGKVPVTVFRDGALVEVGMDAPAARDLVVWMLGDEYPPYFIYGPLVFTSANQVLVRGLIGMGAAQGLIDQGSPLVRRQNDPPGFPGEEIVLIPSRLFPHPVAKGYDDPLFSSLKSVNGVEIENLAHLVKTLRGLSDEFVEFEFHDKHQEHLVFRRAEIMAATEEVLTDNGIRHPASDELRVIWED